MDPKVEDTIAQLHQIKEARLAQEKLEEMWDEFHREMLLCRTEDSHLKDYKNLFDSLDQEKKAHVEELRNINNDMNTLETGIKQSEAEQVRSLETARQLWVKMGGLRDQLNRIRGSMGEEPLPENLVKSEDIERLLEPPQNQSQPQPTLPSLFPLIARDFPVQAFFDRSVYAQHPTGGFSLLRPPPAINIGSKPESNRPEEIPTSPEIGSSSGFGKQQPPPMKTCNSCQQQIHRNAPICPMCKSKSRSKNPKKPKRRTDEI